MTLRFYRIPHSGTRTSPLCAHATPLRSESLNRYPMTYRTCIHTGFAPMATACSSQLGSIVQRAQLPSELDRYAAPVTPAHIAPFIACPSSMPNAVAGREAPHPCSCRSERYHGLSCDRGDVSACCSFIATYPLFIGRSHRPSLAPSSSSSPSSGAWHGSAAAERPPAHPSSSA